MQKYSSVFSRASTRIANAATRTCTDYSIGNLPDEPTFTGALVARFSDALDGQDIRGVYWSASVLSSHGPDTQEKKYGADFLGILDLRLPELTIRKGFLAQAKRQEPGSKLSKSEWGRLVGQCKTMLSHTSESFVFLYSVNGVFIIPSAKVIACTANEDLHTLTPDKTGPFYRRHFECFVGDLQIDSLRSGILGGLDARNALEVVAMAD